MDYVLSRDIHLAPSPVYSLVRKAEDNMLPYQWEALNDRLSEGPKSYSVRNLRAAAGEIDAPHAGAVFQDSDLFKWIEAAAYALKRERNEELEKKIDWLVALMRKAQLPDGYLDTYYILTDISKRFTNLRDHHELYCLGHLIEAAVAYYEATDKKDILDVTLRYVELVNATFGFEEGKKQGYPGHEEIELALVKLYRVTRDPMHLDLAKYFISVRGTNEYFDEEAAARGDKPAWAWSVYSHRNRYYQADEPVAEMTMAKGHSVRQLYLLTGMAELAYETGDEKLKAACDTMWKDITRRQMYITGAVGQSAYGEAFTLDYDLPSDLVYGETCAAISLYFFASAMLKSHPLGEYGDIMDTLLYNGTISGINEDGTRYFYVNPLECIPKRSKFSQSVFHVRTQRQPWYGCACCPPNIARMLTNLDERLLFKAKDTLYVNLFASLDAETRLDGGIAALTEETSYPEDGNIRFRINKAFPGFTLALRLPGWVQTYSLKINGQNPPCVMDEGFIYISDLKDGDEISYILDMPARLVSAHPASYATVGKAALMRGPVVYCLEEVDNGGELWNVLIKPDAPFTVSADERFGTVITAPAFRQKKDGWDEYELYAPLRRPAYQEFTARFIPYRLWNNRGEGEMRVWLRLKEN